MAWSLPSSALANVVLPEPGKPHTMINLEPPDSSISGLWLMIKAAEAGDSG
jgi:hypothetical protein